MNCIFCDNKINQSTKPEHVLLNALGGRKTTKRTICSACNNEFGNSIDKELARQFEFIRNLLRLNSGSGKSAPTLKGVKAGTDIINVRGDGKLSLAAKPFTLNKLPDGKTDVSIIARSMEHLRSLIPDIAAATKFSETDVTNKVIEAEVREIERRPGTVNVSLSFGGQDAIRSAAKACLVLWALHVGNDEVRGTPYQEARDFVKIGSDMFTSERTDLDTRYLNNIDKIKSEYGPLFNYIYVKSDQLGRVIGHFTIYNIIGFQIVLTESGGVPNQHCALVSNPLSPANWSDEVAFKFDQPFEWLENPEYYNDLERPKQRISDVMKSYFDLYRDEELHRIMDSVFNKYGIKDNDPIPVDKRDIIFSEIIHRISAFMVGVPYENRISSDQVKAFFKQFSSDDDK